MKKFLSLAGKKTVVPAAVEQVFPDRYSLELSKQCLSSFGFRLVGGCFLVIVHPAVPLCPWGGEADGARYPPDSCPSPADLPRHVRKQAADLRSNARR